MYLGWCENTFLINEMVQGNDDVKFDSGVEKIIVITRLEKYHDQGLPGETSHSPYS